MKTSGQFQRPLAPLGCIEPDAPLLHVPPDDHLLYKVMKVEDLLRSVADSYLYFKRVDSYEDFSNADRNDGQQLPMDQMANAAARFEKAPDYSLANYYDQCRGRTYACCFSTENSDFIWNNYGNGSKEGKVCVVFEFGKLRTLINQALGREGLELRYNDNICRQIFSINYGQVNYVEWDSHRTSELYFSHPALYTYIKAARYSPEKELRISLSATGIGHFSLRDGTVFEFPPTLQMGFDFRKAIASGALREILLGPDTDTDFLKRELANLRIGPSPDSKAI